MPVFGIQSFLQDIQFRRQFRQFFPAFFLLVPPFTKIIGIDPAQFEI